MPKDFKRFKSDKFFCNKFYQSKWINVEYSGKNHIDSNRKNNNLNNLIWLCMNCYYLVHNHYEKI